MPKDTIFNSTNKGTLWPNAKPLQEKGDAFIPIKLPDFGQDINLLDYTSANNLITLFTIYYTPKIIDIITKHINNYTRELKDNLLPYICANQQYLTYYRELYIYFIIYIYITLYIINEILDYQNISKITPKHAFIMYILRN